LTSTLFVLKGKQVNEGELHAVLTDCLEFAEEMLTKTGEFYPFGAVMKQDRTLTAVGFTDGQEHPSPQEIYTFAVESLKRSALSGEIVAGALAVNVDIPSEYAPTFPDGVRVALEGSGYSRLIYHPYRIVTTGLIRKKRTVEFGEMFAVEAPPSFFVDPTAPDS